jgi:hypothetical protein
MKHLLGLLAALVLTVACSSTPEGAPEEKPAKDNDAKTAPAPTVESKNAPPKFGGEPAKPAEEEEEEEERSFLTGVLLYLPNRVMDIFDVARAGVNVGPGIGVDVSATEYLQAQAFTHASVGVGLETLRHSPLFAGAEAGVGIGPLGAVGDAGATWYRSPGDFRVGLYLALVGAHVAIEPVEILDFILGFLTIDLKDDDF